MNSFVQFLQNSYIFKNEKLGKKIYLLVKDKIELKQENLTDQQKEKIIEDFINSEYFLKNFNIIYYPHYFIDIKRKCVTEEFIIYSLSDYFDSVFKEKKNFDYFILRFDNTQGYYQFKKNPLKLLKCKIRYNGSIYLLTSILYSSGDNLKIQYKNIWDLTDGEYEIRQEYFFLNGKPLLSKDILDTYEKHNGDDEYFRENDYDNRVAFCLYEKYNEDTDKDFVEKLDYPEVDEKYYWIHNKFRMYQDKVNEKEYDINKIREHLLAPPADFRETCGISSL